jgi:hypothetical protein
LRGKFLSAIWSKASSARRAFILLEMSTPRRPQSRKAINPQIVMANGDASERAKIGVKFGTITALYRREHLPALRKSTRDKNVYLLRDFIEAKCEDMSLIALTPRPVCKKYPRAGEPRVADLVRSIQHIPGGG